MIFSRPIPGRLKFSTGKINVTTEPITTFTNRNRDTLFVSHCKTKGNKGMNKEESGGSQEFTSDKLSGLFKVSCE